jgi:hypothetical protein
MSKTPRFGYSRDSTALNFLDTIYIKHIKEQILGVVHREYGDA